MGILWLGLALSQMLVMLDKALRLAFTLLKSMWFSFWRKEWCCLIYWRSLDLVQKLCPKQGFASFLAVLWLVTARQAFQIYRHCLEGLFLYLWLDIYMTSFVKADSRVCWNDSCSALLCSIRKAKHTIRAFCPAKACPVCFLWPFLCDSLKTFMLEFSLNSGKKIEK